MSFEEELTCTILSPNEQRLSTLDTSVIQIKETDELYNHRILDIDYVMLEDDSTDLSKIDELLVHGNKIFRPKTCSGVPCLFVIDGPKEPDYQENALPTTATEVSIELQKYGSKRNDNFQWTVNNNLINTYFGHLYGPGIITGPSTVTNCSGKLTPLAIINKIQENTNGEFQYRYEYHNGVIKRYIDFLDKIGKSHTQQIELGENATEIKYRNDESKVYIGAEPIGEPGTENDTFHQDQKRFEDMVIVKGQNIPLWVKKDESGALVNGPQAAAPYAKNANEGFVVCDNPSELVASYQRIHGKEGSETTYPKLYPFTSSETNEINLYWECIKNTKEHLQPQIDFTCQVMDLNKLYGGTPEYYNTGDVVLIKIPNRADPVQCRVTKTVKDPRKPEEDEITISTYRTSFMAQFFKSIYKSPGSIVIE